MNNFDLTRAQFVARAAAPDISANVLKLGYVIAYKHMDAESKKAVVGQETLAADLNVTVRSLQNLLPKLTPIGLIIEPSDGRSKLSVYRIGSGATELESAKAASPIEAERTNDIASSEGETAKPSSPFPELTPPTPVRTQEPMEGFAAFWQACRTGLRSVLWWP